MTEADVIDTLNSARRTPAWPPTAVINDGAPAKFRGRRVKMLDVGGPGTSLNLVACELADEPPCTMVRVPPENLDLEAAA